MRTTTNISSFLFYFNFIFVALFHSNLRQVCIVSCFKSKEELIVIDGLSDSEGCEPLCSVASQGQESTRFDIKILLPPQLSITRGILPVTTTSWQCCCWCHWGSECQISNGADSGSALSPSLLEWPGMPPSNDIILQGFLTANVPWPSRGTALCTETTEAGSPTPTFWHVLIGYSNQSSIGFYRVANPTIRDEESFLLYHFQFLTLSLSSSWCHLQYWL